MSNFSSISVALEQIKKGNMLILVDHPKRENEADFYIPADQLKLQHLITMIRQGGGLICCAITQSQAHRLHLPLMAPPWENTEKTKVNFTVSVNAKNNVSTGISAFDRLKTIKILANPRSKPEDLIKPGHVFGLVAKTGGVLKRAGHTEAAVDLSQLAGFNPAGVICEIIGSDGRMARLADLKKLAQKLHIKIVAIEGLVKYLKKHPLGETKEKEELVKTAYSLLPTKYGTFKLFIYKSLADQSEHVVLLLGKITNPILTRVHSQCLTGDTLLSLRCDCGAQLHQSMKLIQKKGQGVILYLNQEGRGIGLTNKIKAYALQDLGLDTVEANTKLGLPIDARGYKIAADMLKDLGISKIYLLTNNPDKEQQLSSFGIDVLQTVPLEIKPNKNNKQYLATKKQKLSHHLREV
ncbi:GTP cyclohydrolase II [Candidatus Daviesbacteria bacterium]|nr:GTP cyclohydrolase II [Candidatus Daviesbacteria bacterium]